MAQLSLTVEGAGVLEGVLIEYLSQLRTEIGRTDAYEFRRRLKRKEIAPWAGGFMRS